MPILLSLLLNTRLYMFNHSFPLCFPGFPLGSTVQSKTKGIWMLCVPHPQKPDHTLVLLDTEGLGDIEKVRIKGSVCNLSPHLWILYTVIYAALKPSMFICIYIVFSCACVHACMHCKYMCECIICAWYMNFIAHTEVRVHLGAVTFSTMWVLRT